MGDEVVFLADKKNVAIFRSLVNKKVHKIENKFAHWIATSYENGSKFQEKFSS